MVSPAHRSFVLPLVSGTIFGSGLALSGMLNPVKIRGFLDWFGAWDPTLAFVMAGAVVVMALAWAIQKRMSHPLADSEFHLPPTRQIDGRLLGGSALFGMGWGLAGLCPGPGIASLATHPVSALAFVVPMLGGMVLYALIGEYGVRKGGR